MASNLLVVYEVSSGVKSFTLELNLDIKVCLLYISSKTTFV